MQILIFLALLLGILVLALLICIASDRLHRWRQLQGIRRRMLGEPDFPDEHFSATFTEIEPATVLEMRRMLALFLGIDARKIRPEWRFLEEPDLKAMDMFIFHEFACRYAPDPLRTHQPVVFPVGKVSTVEELFLEASKLQKRA